MPAKVSAYFVNLLCELLTGGSPSVPDTLYLGLRGEGGEIGTKTPAGYARAPVPRMSLLYYSPPGTQSLLIGGKTTGNGAVAPGQVNFPMFTDTPSPNGAAEWFLTDAKTGPGNEWASGPLDPGGGVSGHLTQPAAAGSRSVALFGYLFSGFLPGENLNLYDQLVLGSVCGGDQETVQVVAIQQTGHSAALVTLASPLSFAHAQGESFTRDGATRYYSQGFVEYFSLSIGFTEIGFTEIGFTEIGFTEIGFTEIGFTEIGFTGGFLPAMNRYLTSLLNESAGAPPEFALGLINLGPSGAQGYQEVSAQYPVDVGGQITLKPTGYFRQPVNLTGLKAAGGILTLPMQTWTLAYAGIDSAGAVGGLTVNNLATHWFLVDTAGGTYAQGRLNTGGWSSALAADAPSETGFLLVPSADAAGLGMEDYLLVGTLCGGQDLVIVTGFRPPLGGNTQVVVSPSAGNSSPSAGNSTVTTREFHAAGEPLTRVGATRVYADKSVETVTASLQLSAG